MNKKVAIYCRVSKDEQNPKHQEIELLKFANENKMVVYRVYTDFASGKKDSRPMLNDLLFDMRKGKFKTILVWKLDRLGRSLQHLINIAQECFNKNVRLIFRSQNIDTTTAQGKFFYQILGAVAEFESELISDRTILGQKGAKNIGKRGKDKKQRSKSGYYRRWENHRKKMGVGDFD